MARRRASGEGSIVKYKRRQKRKDGTTVVIEGWQAELLISYGDDGKRKRKFVYGKTQREVREKLDELKSQLTAGTLTTDRLTVKEYLERWLSEKARQVKPRTAELYREQATRYIYPRLGGAQLAKVTPMHIQNLMSELADVAGVSTASKCGLLMFSALKQAIRWELISRNPVEAVDKLKEAQHEMTLWTPAEVVRFLEAAQTHRPKYGANPQKRAS